MKTANQCKNKLVMNAEKEKYKWLVMATVFFSQALTYGITYSVGVFYKEWTRYFDATASFLSLVGSAPTAISCLLGKIIVFFRAKSELCKQCRVVSRAGFSGRVRVQSWFGSKVDKNFGRISSLRRVFCLKCTKI